MSASSHSREPDPARLTSLDWTIATFSIAAIALHDGAHVRAGRYWDVFWICNVAALFVGPAVLFRSAELAAVALTWLVPGTLVWLVDVFVAGSNILPTSYAVHFGGTAAAFYATRKAGFSERGWVASLAVLVGAVIVSRLWLPPAANVNAAHSVPRGWSFMGRSRFAFAGVATAISMVVCLAGRFLGRSVARKNVSLGSR